MNRSRLAVAAGLIAVVGIAGCDRVKTELLQPQNPGLIDPSAVTSPTAALALRIGANAKYKQVISGEGSWQMAGTLADEFKNADFLTPRIDVDQRTMDDQNDWSYSGLTQSRGFVRDAIIGMKKYAPDSLAMIGELYTELGFLEMSLADMYCNGIVMGHTDNGVFINGGPVTTQQVYDSANAHFDTALATITGADAFSVYVRRATQVFKARALVMQGKFATAGALVSVANVPTSYIYDMTFSATGGTNGMWSLANSTARISVADSFDIGVPVITNAIPFATLGLNGDPRVPVVAGAALTPKVAAEDGVTVMFLSQLWKNNTDPMNLASGVDARMIEAEVALNNNDIPGMMAILNTLRTQATRPIIGLTTVAAMAALPTPGTQALATALFFREKALWTFGRGQRLPDMRRMLRLYPTLYPSEANVFPKGSFFKGGNYGTDVNFQIPKPREGSDPLFVGCLDRKP